MSEYTTEIPTRLGYIGLTDHADIFGKNCYPEITKYTRLKHRTYRKRSSGTWTMSVYFTLDNLIHSIEINTTYFEVTKQAKKANEILRKDGPLTQKELFKKLKQ